VSLDLPGFGESEKPPAVWGSPEYAEFVGELFDQLELGRVDAIVGHSFGGFVSLVYAGAAGARPAALVVVDSRARIGERAARLMQALRKLPQPQYATLDDAVRRFRLLPADTAAPAPVLAHVARHAMQQTADGAYTLKFDRRALSGAPAQDLTPALRGVRCPILAVRGAESQIVSHAALAEFPAANPRACTAEIAGAHHHVMLDRPAELARVMRQFLDAHGTALQTAPELR
jgi:pimeloyl-ACP methyl ester carboxylesterase